MQGEPYTLSVDEVLHDLDVRVEEGLSSAEARHRRARFGRNVLREAKTKSVWIILLDQFRSLIVLFLMAAMSVAALAGDHLEAGAIGLVILINGLIGFFSELQAVRSMEALRQLGQVPATVRREGEVRQLPADALVPGDIVLIDGGDVVTADLRLVEASKLQADEAALTGESIPVDKTIEVQREDAPLAERADMLYKGTAVTRGAGAGVVVATGMSTEIGKITALVDEAFDTGQTPLEKRLDQLGQSLIGVTVGVCVLVAVAGLAAGRETLLVIETALALAVAAIPEGLPIVATLALARGMWRMAQRNALINRLAAVETLGATNVICTDKTGTLTEGQMTVRVVVTEDAEVTVTGGAVEGRGHFERDGQSIDVGTKAALASLLEVGVLCNDATWSPESRGIGDPLEVALLVAGHKAGITRGELLESMPEVKETAFDPDVKMMATYHRRGEALRVAVKGAPEAVLEACSHIVTASGERPIEDRESWHRTNEALAERGLRVLALAEKTVGDEEEPPYEGLSFLGFCGLVDPSRSDVAEAITRCRAAGIRVVMLTGDQLPTARYVGREVGLAVDDAPILHGADLRPPEEMPEEARREVLQASVFARVTPAQKLDLVRLYQEQGLVVAMTGDGVNDAPALKQADIGIAMGRRGTQVAREASDMILRDDAFSSIVAAVEQGRIIFRNIRTFIRYLLSCNLSELLVVFLAFLAQAQLPILPLQILFLNLVTDVFPALALGFGRGDPRIMAESPRDPKEPVLSRRHWFGIAGYGGLIAASVLGAFAIAATHLAADPAQTVTISFLTLAMAQLWHVFNMRQVGSGWLDNAIVRNGWVWAALVLCAALLLGSVYVPVLSLVLKTSDPGLHGWTLAVGMSLVPLAVGQALIAARGIRASR